MNKTNPMALFNYSFLQSILFHQHPFINYSSSQTNSHSNNFDRYYCKIPEAFTKDLYFINSNEKIIQFICSDKNSKMTKSFEWLKSLNFITFLSFANTYDRKESIIMQNKKYQYTIYDHFKFMPRQL